MAGEENQTKQNKTREKAKAINRFLLLLHFMLIYSKQCHQPRDVTSCFNRA